MKTYTSSRNLYGSLSGNISSTNLTLGDQLINDSIKYLIQKFNLNERSKTTTTVAGTQFYNLPYNYKRLIDVNITVGTILYTPRPVASKTQWDALNRVVVSSDIPQYYYIYNGQVGFWPKPATSSNTITFNYKVRTRDLSQADYTTGTVTLTNNSTVVTGSGTTFVADMVGRWIQATAPTGDNEWYEIATFTSTTVLGLKQAYNGTTAGSLVYTIGEISILPEEFQDLPIIYALRTYYSGRVKDQAIFQMYKDQYDEKYAMMNAELGTKDDNMVISTGVDRSAVNPNLFITLP